MRCRGGSPPRNEDGCLLSCPALAAGKGANYTEISDLKQRQPTWPTRSAAAHRVEELGVGLGGAHFVDQEFGRLELVHRKEELPEHPDLLQDVLLDQQLFAARAGAVDVD